VGELSFDLAASAWRANATDTGSLVEALASKLEGALPSETRVQRRSTRRFSSEKRVAAIETTLGDHTYQLSMNGDAAECRRSKSVRGVVIKSERLSLDAWLEALSAALTDKARESETARTALERLLE